MSMHPLSLGIALAIDQQVVVEQERERLRKQEAEPTVPNDVTAITGRTNAIQVGATCDGETERLWISGRGPLDVVATRAGDRPRSSALFMTDSPAGITGSGSETRGDAG